MLKKIFSSVSSSSATKSNSKSNIEKSQVVLVGESGTPILLADIWNHFILPWLLKKSVVTLCKVSKWFRKLLYCNDALWHNFFENPKLSWRKPDKATIEAYANLVPPGFCLWRRLFLNYEIVSTRNCYHARVPTCFHECESYRKGNPKPIPRSRHYSSISKAEAFAATTLGGEIPHLKKLCGDNLTFRVVLLGAGGVGAKSALCIRFVQGGFVDEYDPTIEDSYRKQSTIDGTELVFDLLDTAGQEEFSSMRDQWCRNGEAFLVGFAVNSRSSYDEIDELVANIRNFEPIEGVGSPLRPIIVIGNKIDLVSERQVAAEEAAQHSAELGALAYLDMSVKDNKNCFLAFELIARSINRYREARELYNAPANLAHVFAKSSYANALSGGNSSLLHLLMQQDSPDSADLVMKILDASPRSVLNWRNAFGNTPLHCLLLSANELKDPQIKIRRNLIRILLENGADALSVNISHKTPLELAKGTEFEILLLAHLTNRIVWNEKQKGQWEWFARGPFHNVTKSDAVFRNGKPDSDSGFTHPLLLLTNTIE